jgi:ubiquinone/menaquinone biosynthesis C-methylase UbiE
LTSNPAHRDVSDAYNRLAADLDRKMSAAPFLANCYVLYDKMLGRLLQGKRYGRILDMGCGTGLQTIILADAADLVIGIDLAEDLIKLAQARCQQKKNVRFIVDDATRMPFPDHIFDLVVSYGDVVSHIIDGHERAIEEMARVLKPGGLASFEVDNKWNAGVFYIPRELKDACRTRGKGHDTRRWEGMRFKTFTRPELTRILTRHGLSILSVDAHNILASFIPDRYVLEERRNTFWGDVARKLGRVDRAISGWFPFNRFGFNVSVTARKDEK